MTERPRDLLKCYNLHTVKRRNLVRYELILQSEKKSLNARSLKQTRSYGTSSNLGCKEKTETLGHFDVFNL